MSNTVNEAIKQSEAVIIGDILLVEKLPNEEATTKTGIILTADKNQRDGLMTHQPVFVRVISVGAGYTDAEMDTKEGDILLVGDNSTRWFSTFAGLPSSNKQLGIVRESETQIRFSGTEAFERFKALLKESC